MFKINYIIKNNFLSKDTTSRLRYLYYILEDKKDIDFNQINNLLHTDIDDNDYIPSKLTKYEDVEKELNMCLAFYKNRKD